MCQYCVPDMKYTDDAHPFSTGHWLCLCYTFVQNHSCNVRTITRDNTCLLLCSCGFTLAGSAEHKLCKHSVACHLLSYDITVEVWVKLNIAFIFHTWNRKYECIQKLYNISKTGISIWNEEPTLPLQVSRLNVFHRHISRIEPHEKHEIGYERIVFADNGSSVGILPDPDECHDGTLEQFEKFKVKVYIGSNMKFWNYIFSELLCEEE